MGLKIWRLYFAGAAVVLVIPMVLRSILMVIDQDQDLVLQAIDRRAAAPYHQKLLLPDSKPESAACLFIMDDNHFLVEWVAYHYHVWNLRSLVVLNDEKAVTSPKEVLDRWKGKIDVTYWENKDFGFVPGKIYTLNHKTLANRGTKIRIYQERQAYFYGQCVRHLYQHAPSSDWVILLDTDEFLALPAKTATNVSSENEQEEIDEVDEVDPLFYEPGGLAQLFKKQANTSQSNDLCLKFPRREYGSIESSPAKVQRRVPAGLNGTDFFTTRWRYVSSPKRRRLAGKSIVLLNHSKWSLDDYPSVSHTLGHEYKEGCIRRDEFRVYQYTGSREQFLSKTQDNRSINFRIQQFRVRKGNRTESVLVDQSRDWLSGFVSQMGQSEAKRLLENAGSTTVWQTKDEDPRSLFDWIFGANPITAWRHADTPQVVTSEATNLQLTTPPPAVAVTTTSSSAMKTEVTADPFALERLQEHPKHAVFYNIFVSPTEKDITIPSGIVLEQLQQIGESYAASTSSLHVYYNTVGNSILLEGSVAEQIQAKCRNLGLKCIHIAHYNEGYEELTLQKVHEFCSAHPDRQVIYLHNKGSYTQEEKRNRWRRHMTRAVTDKLCLDHMDECTTCGLLFQPIFALLYPGNFFVAQCEYVSRLIAPKEFGTKSDAMLASRPKDLVGVVYPETKVTRGEKRWAMEHWIGSHPSIVPCHLSTHPSILQWMKSDNGLPFEFMNATKLPILSRWLKNDLNRMKTVLNDPSSRKREAGFLGGLIWKWYSFYHELPPTDSWIWDYFPDGGEWRQLVESYPNASETLEAAWRETPASPEWLKMVKKAV